ncbi:MAG: ribosome hibernation-promoting factor, HPF/YfiA family [Dehalococcoidales bacterium]
MDLIITGQNIEVLPTVKDYIEKKFGKLDRHFQNINNTKVELSEQQTKSQDQRYRVQVTMDARGTLLRAEERAENLVVAIDKVVPVMDRQIEKYKGKLTRKGNKNGPSIKSKIDEEPSPEVVRTKRFTMKPMSVEDAITQMELLGHDFFLFYNSSTKEYNLLYLRKDGNYSLIEPELQ